MPTARFPSDSRCCGDSMPWSRLFLTRWVKGVRETFDQTPVEFGVLAEQLQLDLLAEFLREIANHLGKRLKTVEMAACESPSPIPAGRAYCARVAQVRSTICSLPCGPSSAAASLSIDCEITSSPTRLSS